MESMRRFRSAAVPSVEITGRAIPFTGISPPLAA